MEKRKNKYAHISFKPEWDLSFGAQFSLGQCDAIVKAISYIPITPDYKRRLFKVALIKGAQATAAIEGNTLTEKEIEGIEEGQKLPPSKEYLGVEIKNVLEALNGIRQDVIVKKQLLLITPDLIKKFHKMVGKGLGNHFEAIPGEFRKRNVSVGFYKPPDFGDVERLVASLCTWIDRQFHFSKGQTFEDTIIQAIVTHIYLIWIHPFSDGNGRTARLIEFYLLLRAGVPDIASHVLSNFYNLTRSEYYRQIEKATQQRNLTDFISYAIVGLRDGLLDILRDVQESQLKVSWRNYIYTSFDKKKSTGRISESDRRRRFLMLAIRPERKLTAEEILELKPEIIRAYKDVSDRTFIRDLERLIKMNLLVKEGKRYRANINVLTHYMASMIVRGKKR